MSRKYSLNDLAVSISSLTKGQLKRRIKNFRGGFKMDFTEDYLDGLGIERLRHILMAALMTSRSRAKR